MKLRQAIEKTHGSLTVLGYEFTLPVRLSPVKIGPRWFVVCECSCGRDVSVYRLSNLKTGNTTRCALCRKEVVRTASVTHGMSRTPTMRSYTEMIGRCTKKWHISYRNYGGRGITVHPEWLGEGGFERFYAHIGPRPSTKHSLDRINNNGNYEPGNVRWATRAEQSLNKRTTVFMETDSGNITLVEAAKLAGVRYKTFWYRHRRRRG